ncbi:MAG: hypothetical protein GXP53_10365 [Deltaproteobacteria bacterium]|nr:hypothetical protein [Deltaproteobacteria bacterium]
MSRAHKITHVNKFLRYILERRPDEFGLVPDENGWITLKSLLQAFAETEDWRHIRKNDIKELLFYPDCGMEISENRIRAKDRRRLPVFKPCIEVPKLLYTCVRRRAYSAVLDKGLFSGPGGRITCFADLKLAKKAGERFDPKPVLLTIHTSSSTAREIKFSRFGEFIFLCDMVPAGAFTGPSLGNVLKTEPEKAAKTEKKESARMEHPGTYIITPEMAICHPGKKTGKGQKKKIPWKEGRRQSGRHKK